MCCKNIKVWSVDLEGICSTAKKTNGKVVFASMRQSSNQVWGLFSLRLLGTWKKEKLGMSQKHLMKRILWCIIHSARRRWNFLGVIVQNFFVRWIFNTRKMWQNILWEIFNMDMKCNENIIEFQVVQICYTTLSDAFKESLNI